MKVKANNLGARIILQAAADGDCKAYDEAMLGYPSKNPRPKCSSGCFPLHYAAGGGHIEMLRHLLRNSEGNVDERAVGKAKGRTPLHYAARNGHLDVVKFLIEECGADADVRAKHGVSPFQLSVWQNHLMVCKYLVDEAGVDPAQVNDFECGAVHWVGLCPIHRSSSVSSLSDDDSTEEVSCIGEGVLPMLYWLRGQKRMGVDFTMRQRQGHTSLHKAAWGGHLAVVKFLREVENIMDDVPDEAGNYAADLADMANTKRHEAVAQYLREECSSAKKISLSILGLPVSFGNNLSSDAVRAEIRRAYLNKAKLLHPDKRIYSSDHPTSTDRSDIIKDDNVDFQTLKEAYDHLIHHNGIGRQSNPSHSLNMMIDMLESKGIERAHNDECADKGLGIFKAQLLSVLLEYGDKGLDLSNIRKKWKQVWPTTPFPCFQDENKNQINTRLNGGRKSLTEFIQEHAGDVVDIVQRDDSHGCVVRPKKFFRRSQIKELHI